MQHDIIHVIRTGDLATLNRLIAEDPSLVHARVDGARTLLHVATDWPGHFPSVRETISTLLAHGADVNAAFHGDHSETPLHWAASSNDLEALDTLLEHGADIEAAGAVIGGGTPLADAVAFGQWRAAHRLVELGAQSTLWQAAALGLIDRLDEHLIHDPVPSVDDVTNAFWHACRGGQLTMAKRLLTCGANVKWTGHSGLTPLDAAAGSKNADLVEWLLTQDAISSTPSAFTCD